MRNKSQGLVPIIQSSLNSHDGTCPPRLNAGTSPLACADLKSWKEKPPRGIRSPDPQEVSLFLPCYPLINWLFSQIVRQSSVNSKDIPCSLKLIQTISPIPMKSMTMFFNTSKRHSLLRLSITCGLTKFKAQSTIAFFATVNQMFGGSSQFPTTVSLSELCAQQFDYRALGSRRKLGGAAEHLIDVSEKRICRLSFEF